MDITKTCAVFACPPICFPWGCDEEDEGCAAMKLELLNAITSLLTEGVTRFNVVLDPGFGLYAAEMIVGLQEMDPRIEMDLCTRRDRAGSPARGARAECVHSGHLHEEGRHKAGKIENSAGTPALFYPKSERRSTL